MNVLELYSGIGGMHYAMEESCVPGKIVAAVDINVVANTVYKHNFPNTNLLQRNIESLTPEYVNSLSVDIILMSPPCQPFTRVGKKKDILDPRTVSFHHIMNILPALKTVKFILVENVKGFENSVTRDLLVTTLKDSGFIYQEFCISPHQYSIPNVRHRYYLIAKKLPGTFSFTTSHEMMLELPFKIARDNYNNEEHNLLYLNLHEKVKHLNKKYQKLCECKDEEEIGGSSCFSLSCILENNSDETSYYLEKKILANYSHVLDIVTPDSKKSCCFTKAYGHYAEGTGSVLCKCSQDTIASVFEQCGSMSKGSEEYVTLLKSLNLRYFTPQEILRLMGFPDTFSFPQSISKKQKYRLIGNSLNVHIVSLLLVLLTYGDNLVER